jgi:HSP20 family protein
MYVTPFSSSFRVRPFPFDRFFAALDSGFAPGFEPATDGAAAAKAEAPQGAEVDAKPALPVRVPRVEVQHGDAEHTVYVEVPGVAADGVAINAEKGELKLVATAPKWLFKRSFALPDDIDVEQISAQLDSGILTLRLPRAPASRPRQIRVEGAKE